MSDNLINTAYHAQNASLHFFSAVTERAMPHTSFEAHSHISELEIYRFLSGSLFFFFEGIRIPVKNGSIIAICDNTLHRPIITAPCRYERQRLMIARAIAPKPRILRQRQILISAPENPENGRLHALFHEIERCLAVGDRYGELCATVSALSLLIEMERSGVTACESTVVPHSEKVAEILSYINSHIDVDLSYHALAARFYLSKKSLYHLFKREVGFTLSEYIQNRRIVKAKSVLNSGGTAREAATAAGFRDYTVFYRSFRRELGMTPTQYVKSTVTQKH